MSKKDTSLENIDIVKLLLFIFIFALIALVMVFGFLVPNIKEYRKLSRENNSQMASYVKVKQLFDMYSANLNSIKQDNQFLLKSYDSKFDKDDFIKFTSKFFKNVSLNQIDKTEDSEYFLYELKVTSLVKTPKKFYDFLDSLGKYSSIIKAEFPIKMTGDGENIDMTFNIKVYGNKQK
ncbi:hypothetical protein [Campylobacter pinnipediorum]|uniref:Uncharacterized protein n=1 Tax=Campylobacter pinnipediorum subsp. pinnipediorum TaxID=1660067 RepID=A0AAX0LCX4_9BACT|nr:hypothetical protein [Campylobacter pinnipediorum]OPA79704.1 hypothetical protein BFG05_00945 [Campylobacter pinnipediorum subsp. pinnipediorum]OPA81692.1 hypothetical protein BFG04_00695 [Campylobacter pinnipediorum subsp. pinnipediorum]